jgi:hypothetical protein
MDPLDKKKLPLGSKPLRCPACQSSNVHVAPREGEFVVIVCINCYKRWAVSLEPPSDSPEVA